MTDKDRERLMIEQIILHTMLGGGMLGRDAMTNPATFYIDKRVGRLPYTRKAIQAQVTKLARLAVALEQDPKNLPVLW